LNIDTNLQSKKFSIYNANDIGINFKNLIIDIQNYKTLDKVLIWSTMESDLPGGNEKYDFDSLNRLCETHKIVVNIVFGIPYQGYYNKINSYDNLKLHFWPTYLLHYTYNKFDNYYDVNIEQLKKNRNFKKLFLSYNNKPHLHRCKLIDRLNEFNLFEYGEISWNLLNDVNYQFKHWEEQVIKIDDFNSFSFHRSNHIIDNTSFLFLVTESCDNLAFITEKTFKPILIEQPFICLGGRLQNIILKELGFELYDELFDYSFDYLDDINHRVDGIISNLNRIKNDNYYELYKKIETKIKHNKERAVSIVKNRLFIPNIITENNISFEL
jgi:hypothetical protein